MQLSTRPYCEQLATWPDSGCHILAQYDDETIVVYQAYSANIGQYALEHGVFGGDFKYSRMSWIKPNFLWMMYRSSWGQAQGQDVVLGIRLRRTFFDAILDQAIPSSFSSDLFADHDAWKRAVAQSDVRLQWDPDHLPNGEKCQRRAIQLGVRGKALEAYGRQEIVEIIDMSDFVREQRRFIDNWRDGTLLTPVECVYEPKTPQTAARLGLSHVSN